MLSFHTEMISAYFPLENVLLRGDAKILNFESACYSKSVSIPLRLQVARLLNLFRSPRDKERHKLYKKLLTFCNSFTNFLVLNVFDNMNFVSCRLFN